VLCKPGFETKVKEADVCLQDLTPPTSCQIQLDQCKQIVYHNL